MLQSKPSVIPFPGTKHVNFHRSPSVAIDRKALPLNKPLAIADWAVWFNLHWFKLGFMGILPKKLKLKSDFHWVFLRLLLTEENESSIFFLRTADTCIMKSNHYKALTEDLSERTSLTTAVKLT